VNRVTLGDDPWSERVIGIIKDSPHQATLRLWADGKDPAHTDTPYVEYLVTQKRAPVEKAVRMQAAFRHLSESELRDPVEFRIHASGEIGCEDGFHRLNILYHRGEPLTGIVTGRHHDWYSLRDAVERKLATSAWKGALYHPIPHPDFTDWPTHHRDAPPLSGLIERYKLRTVLDLGTHFGYALYSLRHHIHSGVGIERDPVAYRVARLVLERVRMTAVRGDIVRYLRRAAPVDLVLALNVLHHVPLDETVAAMRARFVAVTLPTPNEEGARRLPSDPYEHIRQRLHASTVWEGDFEGRRLHLLRVTP
jgi:SAM-dependent methyltransferase